MLHAKIIDSSIEKIEISKAEHFLKSEKFGAVIYFVGVVFPLLSVISLYTHPGATIFASS